MHVRQARVYKKSFIMDDSSMMELQINALVIIHYCDLQLFSNLYKPRRLASHELLPSSSTSRITALAIALKQKKIRSAKMSKFGQIYNAGDGLVISKPSSLFSSNTMLL